MRNHLAHSFFNFMQYWSYRTHFFLLYWPELVIFAKSWLNFMRASKYKWKEKGDIFLLRRHARPSYRSIEPVFFLLYWPQLVIFAKSWSNFTRASKYKWEEKGDILLLRRHARPSYTSIEPVFSQYLGPKPQGRETNGWRGW